MKKKILLSAAFLALTAPLSFAMDNLEIQSGETKIKMTLTKPVVQKEEVQEFQPFLPKVKKVDLGNIDPATSSISTLDELAKYAFDHGKAFYFNTTSGLTKGGGSATALYLIQKWQGDCIVGLIDDGYGNPIKSVILKNQVTAAYVDASMPVADSTKQ